MKTFWVCGHHTVNETIKNLKRKVIQVICKQGSVTEKLCTTHNVTYQHYKHKDENKIVKNKEQIAHQNTFAQIEELPNLNLKDISQSNKINFIALENITDVRNIGSIIRTAVCFGIQGLIIEKKNFKSDSMEIYKSSSGAMEHIDIYAVSNLNQSLRDIKKKNFFIYGFDSNQGEEFNESTIENVFVLGSEGSGLKELTKKNCDFLIKLNMANTIESLNVANACSAALGIFNYISNKKKAQ
jgi:23S rRNA (guanosine2251-2'-O)-methyltransferase